MKTNNAITMNEIVNNAIEGFKAYKMSTKVLFGLVIAVQTWTLQISILIKLIKKMKQKSKTK